MRQKLKAGDSRFEVVSSGPGADGVLKLVIDGAAAQVEVLSTSPGRHAVRLDGRSRTIHAATAREGCWVWCEGRAWLVADAAERKRPGGGALGGVTPPMPGVVVRILVEVGQKVARGQPLVVVSAMKMETSLVAGFDGTVSAIRAAIGANVKPGDILVDVEPDPAGDGK